MAIIPQEEKVFMVSNGTNTTYSGSAALKAMQQWYTMQDVTDSIRPYKVYTALLTQSGTNAPVATVLENTLGEVTYSYTAVGKYSITSNGLFLTNKTVVFFGDIVNNANGLSLVATIQGEDVNPNRLPFYTNIDGANTNFALLKTPIEIRVYN